MRQYGALDLAGRTLHACRDPQGGTYADTAVFRDGERVTVNGKPVEIAALLRRPNPEG